MRSLARRWLALHDEIAALDRDLDPLVESKAAGLHAAHGIATLTIADMSILIGDDPARIRSEAALARLCGVCPIPASSGRTNRFRLNRGGNRQANAALYCVAIVRMRTHPPTLAYVEKKPQTERPAVKLSDASNDTSCVKSSPPCAGPRNLNYPLDDYRSFITTLTHDRLHRRQRWRHRRGKRGLVIIRVLRIIDVPSRKCPLTKICVAKDTLRFPPNLTLQQDPTHTYPTKRRTFSRTDSSSSSVTLPFIFARRARQSRLLTWSDSTTLAGWP
nr:transposase [Neokomagataea thailandica]